MRHTEANLVETALRNWSSTVERVSRTFYALGEEQLQREVAPGKNRLIYLWGHLAAVNDTLLPLLRLGERLHPELDVAFLGTPDGSVPDSISPAAIKQVWGEINDALTSAFLQLSPDEWLERHNNVSEEDFNREPHRNRFTILLGRTSHLSYHLGQVMLVPKEQ